MTDESATPESPATAAAAAADTPPDRMSVNPRSPHFGGEQLRRGVGIRFNGIEKHNVEEYSISEGWIKVAAGKARDRHGNPMTITLKGTVEPYFEDIAGRRVEE